MRKEQWLKIVRRISAVVLTGLLAFHFLIVIVYLLNDSPIKAKNKRFVDAYISPFFLQNWQLFSPPARSDKILLFRYLKFSNGRVDTVIRNATSNLIARYKDETASSDRVSYFLYRNIIGLCELNNALADSLNKLRERTGDSTACMRIFNRGIERSLFYGNLHTYARNCFFKICDRRELKSYDSVQVVISIIDRRFPSFDERELDFNDEKNFTQIVWNSRPKKLKYY